MHWKISKYRRNKKSGIMPTHLSKNYRNDHFKAGHGFLSATGLLYFCACKQQTTAKIYKLSHVMFTAELAQLEFL
jgi:hypothetical protein